MRTRLSEEYGLSVPVVAAGMAFIARAPLAAAVSAAGGLGTIGASAMPPELLEAEIAAVRAVTDRPFAVNIIPRFAGPELIAAAAAAGVPVVTFFWDDPDPAWLETLHDAGTHVWFQVGSPAEAVAAVDAGADAVVAQGIEAGGHNRSVAGTMTLVPAVTDAVAVPVIAAGGVADGRGLAAVLALGADGALLGTRFIMSAEADAAAAYRERIAATRRATTSSGSSSPTRPSGGCAPRSWPSTRGATTRRRTRGSIPPSSRSSAPRACSARTCRYGASTGSLRSRRRPGTSTR
jgi:NAD(P)H-dependent flavin oxidoreductase YrpB (nitropropane dioxygenase family)